MAKAAEPTATTAQQLAVERARVGLLLTAANMGEFEWDVDRDNIVVSARMAAITGMPEGCWPAEGGEFPLSFVHPEDRDALRQTLFDMLTSEARYAAEYRLIRPDDGRVLWLESSGVVVRPPEGGLQKLIGVVRDVSERKADERSREALVTELDHRVKNVLSAVQSLAAQTARRATSVEGFLKPFSGRLEAMAAAHALLTRTRWQGAEIGDVVAAEIGAVAHGRARWSGPVLLLSPRATNALALALHEMTTNAAKFGALSTEGGRVDVRWFAKVDGGFELEWAERRGPPVETPERQGFGATLLERVTGRELDGAVEVTFRPEGVRVVIIAGAESLAPVAEPAAPDRPQGASTEMRAGASRGDQQASADISGLRVLVVEDAVLLALEIEASLTEAGAVVLGPAASLDEAESMLDQDFDVALLDADLNGRSVAPLVKALQAQGRPFILATGQRDVGGIVQETAAPIVRKPYNVAQIAVALAVATGRREAGT